MRLLHSMALAAGLAIPGMLLAGNVPQYSVTRQYTTFADDQLGKGWELFDDGTVITTANRTNFEPACFIFPDGTESVNGYKGEGFPIGFDFRLGGSIVDQFAVTSNGMAQFGKGSVTYLGGNIALVKQPLLTTDAPFQICMAPIMGGARKGTISYKTIGEEGKRVCIIQWKTMIVDEIAAQIDQQRAKFSLQMRLFEEDGHVELAFIGEQSPMGNLGFFTGIHGWSNDDQIVVATNAAQGQEPSITSPVVAKDLENVGILEPGSYIVWSPLDEDDESFVLTFNPAADTPAPAEAPVDFDAYQSGSSIFVSGKKAADADATIVLYSNVPFAEADLPVDGTTYRVYDNNGDFATILGNSTVIFYNNSETFDIEIPNVEPDGEYYIRAISVNGYPNYNNTKFAEKKLISTQLPPAGFFTETREEGINLHWSSEYPVIVATTTQIPRRYTTTYEGEFGQPDADVKVGDEIQGGGTVIYVGDASECFIENSALKPNFPNMFRIWNVKDGVVSSTASDSYGVPELSMPYVPEVETWPFSQLPVGFETSDETAGWTPRFRDYDHEQSLNGTFLSSKEAGYPVYLSLTTPELPFIAGEPATLEFEWALETVRDPAPADPSNPNSPVLPRGREAGWFGEVPGGVPGLQIAVGPMGMTEVVKVIDKYDGTMVPFGDTGFNDGSSSWQKESIVLENVTPKDVITFTGCSEKSSIMYLRKLSVTQKSKVTEIMPAANGLTVAGVQGGIVLTASEAQTVAVYNLLGVRVAEVAFAAGETATVELPSGLYIAGGVKVSVR